MNQKILITGAGGYVGSKLVAKLLKNNFHVKALDTYWFGSPELSGNNNLEVIKADIRTADFEKILEGVDRVVHLASISNDPSYELNLDFSKEINFDASLRLLNACRKSKIKRFIFASSSSVYGVKSEQDVTEELSTNPLTEYSLYKLKIEEELKHNYFNDFDIVMLRPATICGPSLRMRLDIIGNIFSAQGFFDKKITVFGGEQYRAQLHIEDMIRCYELCIVDPRDFGGAIYNVSEKNYQVVKLASLVSEVMNYDVAIEIKDTVDQRSYRLSADKIKVERGFLPLYSGKQAIEDNVHYFNQHHSINWQDEKYHNIKTIKKILNGEHRNVI